MIVKSLQCRIIRYREFPDLLFGKSQDGKFFYFDATHYIQKMGDSRKHNIRDFQIGFQHWIMAAKQTYEIQQEELIICDEATGHILIDECLALMFLAYIDPGFGIYIMERMSEMLVNGIAVSDTWLIQATRLRFTTEELISNLKGEHEK